MTANSAQGQWLKTDLAASKTKCTVAYWHHPLFTSAQNGPRGAGPLSEPVIDAPPVAGEPGARDDEGLSSGLDIPRQPG